LEEFWVVLVSTVNSPQDFNPSKTYIEASKVHCLENPPWSKELVSNVLANSVNHARLSFTFQKGIIPEAIDENGSFAFIIATPTFLIQECQQ
jgi:hypothetical protein